MPPKELTPEEKIAVLEKENASLKKTQTDLESGIAVLEKENAKLGKNNTDLVTEKGSLLEMVAELQKQVEEKETTVRQIAEASKKAGVRPILEYGGKSVRFTVASFFFAKKEGETEKIVVEEVENDFMSNDKKKKASAEELLKTLIDNKLGVIEIL